jgi:hypothetical protein
MTLRLIVILKNNALNVFTKSPSFWLMPLPRRAVVQRQKIPLAHKKAKRFRIRLNERESGMNEALMNKELMSVFTIL